MSEEIFGIIPNKPYPESMDYNFLRKKAIEYTQKMSGDLWTDYNIHDPGVTILEQFCYALTDISYRTNLDIETLLFHKGDKEIVFRNQALIPPDQIFSVGPITLEDYRILILDHFPSLISNCWVENLEHHIEGIKGLIKIDLLVNSHVSIQKIEMIKKLVSELYHRYRNFGEDIYEINILTPEHVTIQAEIDINYQESTEDIIAQILFVIERYFHPVIKFHSLEDLRNENLSLDHIYNVPSHINGFIKVDELPIKSNEFHISQIEDLVLKIEGVLGIRNLKLFLGGVACQGDVIPVPDNSYLTLGIAADNTNLNRQTFTHNIAVLKGGIKSNYYTQGVVHSFELLESKQNPSYQILNEVEKRKSKHKGQNLADYLPIEKTFPEVYGVGDYLRSSEDPNQYAHSKQLQGYLTFFDQIMANHLAQLTNISELLSVDDIDPQKVKTYFTQKINDKDNNSKDLYVRELKARDKIEQEIDKLSKRSLLTKKEKELLGQLEDDLNKKIQHVQTEIKSNFRRISSLEFDVVKKTRHFENHLIYDKIEKYLIKKNQTKTDSSINDESSEDDKIKTIEDSNSEKLVLDILENEIVELMSKEEYGKEHYVNLSTGDLILLMKTHDSALERKNKILSHIISRFGEQFSEFFSLNWNKYTSYDSIESKQNDLIQFKSLFLKEITIFNKYKSRGINFLSDDESRELIPTKKKILYLTGLNPNPTRKITGKKLDKLLTPKKISKSSLKEGLGKTSNTAYVKSDIEPKGLGFVINTPSTLKYLCNYATNIKNYLFKQENTEYVVYFKAPIDDVRTCLGTFRSKEEALDKIEKLRLFLIHENFDNENFHILEHNLLRPMDSRYSDFVLKDETKTKDLFRSFEISDDSKQISVARDAVILASFLNNYLVLQNQEKHHIVVIKDSTGKNLARSIETFESQKLANEFVTSAIESFTQIKKGNNIEDYIKLDSENDFIYNILDENDNIMLVGVDPISTDIVQSQVDMIKIYGKDPNNYVIESEGNGRVVYLIGQGDQKSGCSSEIFKNKILAQHFVDKITRYLSEISEDEKRVLKINLKRLSGRNVEDYNLRVSIIYPDWTIKFNNQNFMDLFFKTIFNSFPAHIAVNMVGLNFSDMKLFENLYFEYLEKIKSQNFENKNTLLNLSNGILNLISK
jgi:hypothetical protein